MRFSYLILITLKKLKVYLNPFLPTDNVYKEIEQFTTSVMQLNKELPVGYAFTNVSNSIFN